MLAREGGPCRTSPETRTRSSKTSTRRRNAFLEAFSASRLIRRRARSTLGRFCSWLSRRDHTGVDLQPVQAVVRHRQAGSITLSLYTSLSLDHRPSDATSQPDNQLFTNGVGFFLATLL